MDMRFRVEQKILDQRYFLLNVLSYEGRSHNQRKQNVFCINL